MIFFFFFKQKTAYELRISDWSSDVCSSDLPCVHSGWILRPLPELTRTHDTPWANDASHRLRPQTNVRTVCPLKILRFCLWHKQIGRASCRESVCQYV